MKKNLRKPTLFLSAFIILLSAILLFSIISCCENTNVSKEYNAIDSLRVAYENKATSYYRLGVAAGVNACLRMSNRKLATGQRFTLEEVYVLADSISGIHAK